MTSPKYSITPPFVKGSVLMISPRMTGSRPGLLPWLRSITVCPRETMECDHTYVLSWILLFVSLFITTSGGHHRGPLCSSPSSASNSEVASRFLSKRTHLCHRQSLLHPLLAKTQYSRSVHFPAWHPCSLILQPFPKQILEQEFAILRVSYPSRRFPFCLQPLYLKEPFSPTPPAKFPTV